MDFASTLWAWAFRVAHASQWCVLLAFLALGLAASNLPQYLCGRLAVQLPGGLSDELEGLYLVFLLIIGE